MITSENVRIGVLPISTSSISYHQFRQRRITNHQKRQSFPMWKFSIFWWIQIVKYYNFYCTCLYFKCVFFRCCFLMFFVFQCESFQSFDGPPLTILTVVNSLQFSSFYLLNNAVLKWKSDKIGNGIFCGVR